MEPTPILQIENLKTWFPIRKGVMARVVGYVKAVDGISFELYPGEILGLVGESGCGKTTLGRTLLGLEKAKEGRVRFDGMDLLGLNGTQQRHIRRRIQIVFQDPVTSLNPRMTVADIVTEGLAAFNLLTESREAHARNLLMDVGLDPDAVYRYPHEFSGGQRQRINIARAISVKPDLVVCDEPVSALDVSVQAQILHLLLNLRDRFGLSYLFISHDLSVVSNIAQRIAVMYLGKLMEIGDTKSIISNPLHPYTQALISAVPEPGVSKTERIILTGELPSPVTPPVGCRFHTRCPEAMARCNQESPDPVDQGNRRVWCHLYDR